MSFLLPDALPGAAAATLPEASLASSRGYDDMTPVPTQVQLSEGCLTLTRTHNESGYLVIPWPVEPLGTVVVTSSTLREREEPYRLVLELARGKLNQVRGQAAEWQSIGVNTGPEFDKALTELTRQFGKAALAGSAKESDSLAAAVLEKAHALADRLTREYIEQLLATRHEEEGALDTWFTARHQRAVTGKLADEYAGVFNAANVCFRWRDVEPQEAHYDWTHADAAVAAAMAAGLPVTLGPVLDLAPGMVPDWTANWESDLPALAAFMCDYLETALHRYKQDVSRWLICAGFNHRDSLGLIDDDRLRLAFRLFEAASQIDPHLDLILSVSQPWGDYLRSEEQTISPMTFPDDLVRAGVRLAAVELEIRPAVQPRGSYPRDLLETARILDVFGRLGPPLEVVLSLPSAPDADLLATHQQSLWPYASQIGPTLDGQAAWGAAFASLALCWPKVRSVTWDHWSDAEPHLVPQSGLIDANGRAKPLLSYLRTLRTEHLG